MPRPVNRGVRWLRVETDFGGSMAEDTETIKQINNGLEKVLNNHGFGFHYATLKRAVDAYQRKRQGWFFNVAEFPVETRGSGTRIDFILRKSGSGMPYFLVAECKRANPSLSNWCFVHAPYWYYAEPAIPQLILEHISFASPGSASSFGFGYYCLTDAYGVAIELKSHKEGDKHGAGRGAIEEAATQVIRGLNGFVNNIVANQSLLGNHKMAVFLPVVFTTANLWVSDARLDEADLRTGNIDLSSTSLRSARWIALQYPVSPGIKHSVGAMESKQYLWETYVAEHLRTVCIVHADAIEEFLQESENFDLYLPGKYQV
jgi:hypothetical protein